MKSRNMEDIATHIQEMKFQKKLIGGVDEADVWKKIQLLQEEYVAAYIAQEERFNALLKEREDAILALKRKAK